MYLPDPTHDYFSHALLAHNIATKLFLSVREINISDSNALLHGTLCAAIVLVEDDKTGLCSFRVEKNSDDRQAFSSRLRV